MNTINGILSNEELLTISREVRIEGKADVWRRKARKLQEAQEEEAIARQELIDACNNLNYEGNGVKIQEIERKGAIEYSVIPQLQNVNLEQYRKKGSFYWTVKLSLKE